MFTFYFKAIKNFNSYLRLVYDPEKTINSGNINIEIYEDDIFIFLSKTIN